MIQCQSYTKLLYDIYLPAPVNPALFLLPVGFLFILIYVILPVDQLKIWAYRFERGAKVQIRIVSEEFWFNIRKLDMQ